MLWRLGLLLRLLYLVLVGSWLYRWSRARLGLLFTLWRPCSGWPAITLGMAMKVCGERFCSKSRWSSCDCCCFSFCGCVWLAVFLALFVFICTGCSFSAMLILWSKKKFGAPTVAVLLIFSCAAFLVALAGGLTLCGLHNSSMGGVSASGSLMLVRLFLSGSAMACWKSLFSFHAAGTSP